jgi:hypothetical protein
LHPKAGAQLAFSVTGRAGHSRGDEPRLRPRGVA